MDFNLLLQLRDELTVKNHDPGMLELGFKLSLLANPLVGKAMDQKKNAGIRSGDVPGIHSLQVNPIFRTLRLEYDPQTYSPELINEVLTADSARAENALQQLTHHVIVDTV